MVLKQQKFGFSALILLLAFVLGACSGTLPAELPTEVEIEIENGAEELEFSGAIEEMGSDSWTVAGVTFLVNSSTEIQPGLGLGDVVKVHAQLNADDELTAREIDALEDDDTDSFDNDENPDEIEFVGTVEAIGANSWMIGGTTVAVTSSTEIKGDLVVGDLAKVHASMINGVLTAREIEPADEDDEIGLDDDEDENEFFGVVESISAEIWLIDGTDVAINTSTEIKGNPQVGDLVKVHASFIEGVLTAREIEPAQFDDMDDDDADDEFFGVVEAIEGNTWTIGGQLFTVTAETEIEDEVQLGDMVKVELETDTAGNIFVEEIELADDDDLKDDHDDFDDEDEEEDNHDDDNSGSGSDDDGEDD